MTTVFNVKDYGAIGNGVANDTAAIQATIDAASAAGGGEVYIPSGTYIVHAGATPSDGALTIRSNVTMTGDGMGATTLKLADGTNHAVTGIIRSTAGEATHDFGVNNLTIDGNREHTSGKIDGWYNGYLPGGTGENSNVTLSSVEIKDCAGYGFDPHERTANMLIENCVAHGNGLDGFVADYLIDSTYKDNLSYDNDRHGFNVTTTTNGLTLLGNIAHDNGGGGIVIQRGGEDIPGPYNVKVIGGEVYDNAAEGVLVKMSHDVLVDHVDAYGNGTSGVRIYGSTEVTVSNNTVHDDAQGSAAPEIQVQAYNDTTGSSGTWYAATGNTVTDNIITGSADSTYGIAEVNDKHTDRTSTDDNVFSTFDGSAEQLYGAHSQEGSSRTDVLQQGTAGNDTLKATTLNEVIYGNAGTDNLYGEGGQDVVFGGDGNDKLHGGNGNDILIGGAGIDTLYGDGGNDVFRFTSQDDSYSTATTSHADYIADFDPTADKIDVAGLGFIGLGNGHDNTLKVAYNASNGRTYLKDLDPDANGHRFQVSMAGDVTHSLTASQFVFATDPTVAEVSIVGVAAQQHDVTG